MTPFVPLAEKKSDAHQISLKIFCRSQTRIATYLLRKFLYIIACRLSLYHESLQPFLNLYIDRFGLKDVMGKGEKETFSFADDPFYVFPQRAL